jgi:hypothetical protein
MAVLANILSYSDTLLLTDSMSLEVLGKVILCITMKPAISLIFVHVFILCYELFRFSGSLALPVVLASLRSEQQNPQRFYACSAMANASANPILAEVLKDNGGLYFTVLVASPYLLEVV